VRAKSAVVIAIEQKSPAMPGFSLALDFTSNQ
jgi:hypothetical protein